MRTTSKKLRITSLVSVFGLGVPLLIASACGNEAPGQGPISTGGVPSSTGGTMGTTGGTVGNGGSVTTTGGISGTTGGTVGTTGGTTGTTGGTVGTTGGTTGTTGGTVGTTGGTTGTTGGTIGTTGGGGSTSTGGTSTTGGGGSTSTGGTTGGSGGKSGTGGSSTGGTVGTGGSTGGSGGGGSLIDVVAKTLDGKMLTGPCLQATGEKNVCLTNKAGTACNPMNLPTTNPLAGVLTTDTTITLGGDTAKTYSITLHVQGEVEAKEYTGGTDQKTAEAVSTKMDGFHIGGTPTGSNNYNVYMIRASSPAQDYFLNDLIGNGVSDHTTYLIDYTAKITAKGGSTLRLIAADSNCSMIKNCGPAGGTQCSQPLVPDSIDPKAKSLNPSFDFTKAYDGQWVVMVVTDVTEM